MRRLIMISRALIVIAISFSIYLKVAEARYFDSEMLRDLKGIKVEIFIFGDEGKKSNFQKDQIKKDVEKKLERVGINVYKSDTTEFYQTGRPELQINVRPLHIEENGEVDFFIEVEFVLTVRSFATPKVTTRCPITYWRSYIRKGSFEDVIKHINEHTDSFVRAVCNPHKGDICVLKGENRVKP